MPKANNEENITQTRNKFHKTGKKYTANQKNKRNIRYKKNWHNNCTYLCMKTTATAADVQGTENAPVEQLEQLAKEVTGATTATVTIKTAQGEKKERKKEERKIQLGISDFEEMAENPEILKAFITVIKEDEEIKAPYAFMMAKGIVKQMKLVLTKSK